MNPPSQSDIEAAFEHGKWLRGKVVSGSDRMLADASHEIQSLREKLATVERDARQIAGKMIDLRAIGELLRTQDNRITQNPMFCVQQKRRQITPRDFTGENIWVLEGDEVEEGTEGAVEYGVCERWETVMVAFTADGCREYIRQNGHNLREPRIYVESFNRCPEMIAIRAVLMLLPKPDAP